jgi:hypothetical protein
VSAPRSRRGLAELAALAFGLASWLTLLILIPAGVAVVVVRLAASSGRGEGRSCH